MAFKLNISDDVKKSVSIDNNYILLKNSDTTVTINYLLIIGLIIIFQL